VKEHTWRVKRKIERQKNRIGRKKMDKRFLMFSLFSSLFFSTCKNHFLSPACPLKGLPCITSFIFEKGGAIRSEPVTPTREPFN